MRNNFAPYKWNIFYLFQHVFFCLFTNRKFADIEAANHRLASALYLNEEEKNGSSLGPQAPDSSQTAHQQHPEKGAIAKDADGVSKPGTDVSADSQQTEEKKLPQSGPLWKRHPKAQSSTCAARKNNQSKGRQKQENTNHKLVEFAFTDSPKGTDYYFGEELIHTECYQDTTSQNQSPQHPQISLPDSGYTHHTGISASASPELSPLSLDSCDFSVQMFTDISTCTHSQRSIADLGESQWSDIMDLFSGGNSEVEAYLESICACQSDTGQEVGADDFTFSYQSDSLTERCNNRSEIEDVNCEGGEYRYLNAHICPIDEGLTVNHTAGTQFNSCKPAPDSDTDPNRLQATINYNISELQQHQQDVSHCLLGNCERSLSFTPFEGVAQSFSAPLHDPEHRPIATPPHVDDWLFTDILKDRKSPGC